MTNEENEDNTIGQELNNAIKKTDLEKIIEEKIETKTQKLQQQNKNLKKEVEKLKSRDSAYNSSESHQTNSKQLINRREFLHKAGIGTLGLAALVGPINALDIKGNNLNMFAGSDSDNLTNYLSINEMGPVQIENTDLEILDGNLGIGIDNPSAPLEVGGTRGIKVPIGNSTQRASSPKKGEFRINSEREQAEVYFSDKWRSIGSLFAPVEASGGDNIYEYFDSNKNVDYRVHAFTTLGSSTFEITDTGSKGLIDVLIVGGGGGGGANTDDNSYHEAGGGGGAGGVVFEEDVDISTGSFNIFVGDGGVGGEASIASNGEDSAAFNYTAVGGGAGQSINNLDDHLPKNGGSGGGATRNGDGSGGDGAGAQGHEGGGYCCTSGGSSAGGGGFSQKGSDSDGTYATDGGDGGDFSVEFGETYGEDGVFAGGGGGAIGGNDDTTGRTNPGSGGLGGGGDGGQGYDATSTEQNGQSAMANSGGGGGGGGANSSALPNGDGGDGGSGIVLIRYPLQRP